MHDGRVAQVGPPAAVWERPADAFVASFLGWNVTRALGDGLVAIRPDGMRLHTGPGGVPATVTGRTFRRDHYLVEVQIDASSDERLQVAVSVDERVPETGEAVRIEGTPGAVLSLE
jgi:ABC-type Fe3+/spermidine/putrescine transport system ATPase subunit